MAKEVRGRVANRETSDVGSGSFLVLCYPGSREVRYALRSGPYVDDALIAGYLGKHVIIRGTERGKTPSELYTVFEVESITQQA